MNSPGCTLCGYAVDVVRSCYSSKWNLPRVGVVRGYYYFCDPATPFYEKWHHFGSRNWHKGDGTPWPVFGELENVRQVWRDGSFATAKPDVVTIGSAECIAGENADLPNSPPALLVVGVDARCWRHGIPWPGPGRGGLLVGGESAIARGYGVPCIGGLQLGGSSDQVVGYNSAGAGGLQLGGSSDQVVGYNSRAAGGLQLGGSSDQVVGYNSAGAGGLKIGGSCTQRVIYHATGNGGLQLGGSSTQVVSYKAPASGGVKIGGSCTSSKHP